MNSKDYWKFPIDNMFVYIFAIFKYESTELLYDQNDSQLKCKLLKLTENLSL